MTKEDIIELAKQAGFVDYELDDGTTDAFDKRYEAFARLVAEKAIKEVLAQPEQKPVAVKHMMRWVDNLKWQSDNGQHMNIPSGLSSGTCWELAIELEQFIKSTPPQRTWVGLTAKEKHEFRYSHMTTADFIDAIEAKLKEKNTSGQE